MELLVLGQPDPGSGSIGHEMRDALGWPDATQAWFAVAWAKRSGLRLLERELRAFRKGRRTLRALIGVDQHGGTIEGLQLARALFTEARVYHDANATPPRTFHPKLYVVQAPSRARAIVGSGNLTAGGLHTNYELSVRLDLDLRDPHDKQALADLRGWFDLRWQQAEATVRLTTSSIQSLIDDPTVVVVNEQWRPSAPRLSPPPGRKQTKPLFGAVKGLARAPALPKTPPADRVDSIASTIASADAVAASDDDVVLVAGLPKDRPGQAGFNRTVSEDFFGVSKNGDPITAQAVERDGTTHQPEIRPLIFPSRSNQNHRFELPDPEGRGRPIGAFPILMVHRFGRGQFRYLYVLPGDRGYRAMAREITKREAIGVSRKPETKRIYLTVRELRQRWPGCGLLAAMGP